MEGKRQMEMAQTIILKPDSILEYNCFVTYMWDLGKKADKLFSDNMPSPFWSKPSPPGGIFDTKNLDRTLDHLVFDALDVFVGSNFQHNQAGGLYLWDPCTSMQEIWDFLKCYDFQEDYFTTFEEISTKDPRKYPEQCKEKSRAGNWKTALAKAFPVPAVPAPPGGMDATITYLDLLDPKNCKSIKPIPTGLMANLLGSRHADAVCSAPGCYYDYKKNRCKK